VNVPTVRQRSEARLSADSLITSDEPDPSAASPRRSRVTPVRIVTALVLALLVAALVVTQWQLADQRSLNNERSSALSAARTYAADVAGYDYRHLHQDFARVEQEATPSFRRSFIKSSNGLSKVLVQYHATASAKVIAAGLASVSSTQAVVVLFVNQSVSNTAQKGGPTTDDSRITLTLDRSGGRWLISDLKLR
jgi:Mce-associated membrane protein